MAGAPRPGNRVGANFSFALGKHRPRFPADQAGANFDPVTFDPVTSDHVTSDHGTSNGTSNLEQAHPRRRRGPICTISRAGRLADRCTHSCSPWCPFPAFVGDEHSPQCPTYTMTSWSVAAKSEHLAPGEEAQYLRHLPGGICARTSYCGLLLVRALWAESLSQFELCGLTC